MMSSKAEKFFTTGTGGAAAAAGAVFAAGGFNWMKSICAVVFIFATGAAGGNAVMKVDVGGAGKSEKLNCPCVVAVAGVLGGVGLGKKSLKTAGFTGAAELPENASNVLCDIGFTGTAVLTEKASNELCGAAAGVESIRSNKSRPLLATGLDTSLKAVELTATCVCDGNDTTEGGDSSTRLSSEYHFLSTYLRRMNSLSLGTSDPVGIGKSLAA